VAGGAGLVGVGAGVVFLIKSSRSRSEASTLCGSDAATCTVAPEAKPRVDELDQQANQAKMIGVTSLLVGGAALTTGVVLYLTNRKSAPTTAFVRPAIFPGGAAVVGAF
jgi:hypothetical protein